VTNPLDLIRRLADALESEERTRHETYHGDTEPFIPGPEITQARAFLDGAVETTLGTQSALYIYDAG
jgi:hypothetical protein